MPDIPEPTYRGILVGEGPGSDEVESGRPFTGPTGRWLDEELELVGLRRKDLLVVNAMACQPPRGASEDDRRKATEACRGALAAQIGERSHLPKFLMGKWAAFAVTGEDKGVFQRRGFVRSHEGIPYIVSWPPTYAAFRNPYEAGAFEVDLQRFKRMLDGTLEARPRVMKPTVAAIRRLHEMGFKGEPIAVDIETRPADWDQDGYTGKSPTQAVLHTLGLGCSEWGLSLHPPTHQAEMRAAKKLLADEQILKVFHNGWFFDIPVLRRHGICVR